MSSYIPVSLLTSGLNNLSSSLSSFDFTHNISPSCHPIINGLESNHKSEHNASTWFDAATLAGPRVLHTSTQLPRTSHPLEDQFYRSQILETYMLSLHNLRQIKLEPGTLSLFDLAILADCVHNHAPLYSILEHHCYWFIQIICAIIKKLLYPCTTIWSKQYAPVSKDTICIPTNNYLPDMEGRTMEILVCRVEEVILLVALEFEAYKVAKLEEVHFLHWFPMTFANIWVQITTRHQMFNAPHEELRWCVYGALGWGNKHNNHHKYPIEDKHCIVSRSEVRDMGPVSEDWLNWRNRGI